MKHYYILVLLLATLGAKQASAQATDEKQATILALKKLATVYRAFKNLSFDVAWYYADEQKPSVYLDSLRGQFKLSGNNYWYSLANTEIVSDGRFAVVLYKEDSLMYLTRSSAATQMVNPVTQIDSFLQHHENLVFHSSNTGSIQRVAIDFPANGPYKSISYDIDVKTGYMLRMRSVVQSDLLLDPSVRQAAGNMSGYAIVEVWFTRYSTNSFSNAVFDMNHYFRKEGQEYVTVAPYNTYKIFLGTPDL